MQLLILNVVVVVVYSQLPEPGRLDSALTCKIPMLVGNLTEGPSHVWNRRRDSPIRWSDAGLPVQLVHLAGIVPLNIRCIKESNSGNAARGIP